MYKPPYEIIFTKHALLQARVRNIHPDILEDTIQNGRFKRFGKNRLKIIKEYHRATIICVDEKIGNTIKIVTMR